jgi:hypothetical protein
VKYYPHAERFNTVAGPDDRHRPIPEDAMTTFFKPQVFSSVEAMKAVSFFDAISDTSIDGIDIFGFVDGVAYAASYDDETYVNDDDEESSTTLVTAGNPLNQFQGEGICHHCGKSLSPYDGLCRWSDCVTNK